MKTRMANIKNQMNKKSKKVSQLNNESTEHKQRRESKSPEISFAPDLSLRGLGVGREEAGTEPGSADKGKEAVGKGEQDGGSVGGAGRRGEVEPVVEEDEQRGVVDERHEGVHPEHRRRGGRRRRATPPPRHLFCRCALAEEQPAREMQLTRLTCGSHGTGWHVRSVMWRQRGRNQSGFRWRR